MWKAAALAHGRTSSDRPLRRRRASGKLGIVDAPVPDDYDFTPAELQSYFDPKPLNPRREAFCQQYVLNKGNVSAAARDAGYALVDSGCSGAYALLKVPAIQARIAEIREEALADLGLRQERVLEEVLALALADVRELATWDSAGHVEFLASDQISDRAARSVSSIKAKRTYDKQGNVTDEVTLETNPKMPALLALMKYLGLQPKEGAQVTVQISNKLEMAEIDKIIAEGNAGED